MKHISARLALAASLLSGLMPLGTMASTAPAAHTISTSIPSTMNKWELEGNTWFWKEAGTQSINGWKKINGQYYYLQNNAMKTGWHKDGNIWYFLGKDGAMKTGWAKDGSSWYYFTGSGAMKTGWLKSGSDWYYLASSGAMSTGWNYISNNWYYMDASGKMLTSTTVDGYWLNGDGIMQEKSSASQTVTKPSAHNTGIHADSSTNDSIPEADSSAGDFTDTDTPSSTDENTVDTQVSNPGRPAAGFAYSDSPLVTAYVPGQGFLVNIDSGKVHKSSLCRTVKNMKSQHKASSTASIEELVHAGFSRCKVCFK